MALRRSHVARFACTKILSCHSAGQRVRVQRHSELAAPGGVLSGLLDHAAPGWLGRPDLGSEKGDDKSIPRIGSGFKLRCRGGSRVVVVVHGGEGCVCVYMGGWGGRGGGGIQQ